VILESQLLPYGVPQVARLVFFIRFIVILLTIVTIIMMVLAWKNKYWNTWGWVHFSCTNYNPCYNPQYNLRTMNLTGKTIKLRQEE
jgi:hypothetical protein